MPSNMASNMSGTNGTMEASGQSSLTKSQIAIIVIIGIIGFAGTLMNIGVLIVVNVGKLAKKDYRMIYYIFITVGDLMFSLHTVFNSLSMVFRDAWFFKAFAVCFNIQVVFWVLPYQWSAVCIILLIIDLTWTLKFPFTDDERKRSFSKICCVMTFFIAIVISLSPFEKMLTRDGGDLQFCSIANVYGPDWNNYQLGAVVILSVLFSTIVVTSCYLLYIIYRQQLRKSTVKRQGPAEGRRSLARIPSPHPAHANRIKPSTGSEHTSVISVDVEGLDNPVFEGNEEPAPKLSEVTVTNRLSQENGHPSVQKDGVHLTAMEAKKKNFNQACRTVAIFLAVFLGCGGPYYVWMAQGIRCELNCDEDTEEQRTIRAMVAFFLYLLPIIDPILYTQRFDLFKASAYSIIRGCSSGSSS